MAETTGSEKPIQAPRTPIPPDTVFIGKKPLMAYATAVMMHFNGGAKHLTVKARGKSMSQAVDVEEAGTRKLFQGKSRITEEKIGSEGRSTSRESSKVRNNEETKTMGPQQ